MKLPIQITFRNMPSSASVTQDVEEKAAKLDDFYDGIMSCRVAIESLMRRHHRGNVYRVRLDLTVPGEELVSDSATREDHAHEDVYVAIRDAFDDMRRIIQDFARKQRGEVKPRVGPPHGRVVRIFHDRGYGFLEGEEGHEIYFHKNSVLDHGFARLQIGAEVRYEEENGDKGPQASSVAIVGKDGHRLLKVA
jgi:cold shock CspA family protein/ribosome-associated translation inhibitor RaiA